MQRILYPRVVVIQELKSGEWYWHVLIGPGGANCGHSHRMERTAVACKDKLERARAKQAQERRPVAVGV